MAPNGNRIASAGELGTAIRVRRKQLELSQQELAESIGVARRVIGELERGKGSVRLEIALAAARTVGLDITVSER